MDTLSFAALQGSAVAWLGSAAAYGLALCILMVAHIVGYEIVGTSIMLVRVPKQRRWHSSWFVACAWTSLGFSLAAFFVVRLTIGDASDPYIAAHCLFSLPSRDGFYTSMIIFRQQGWREKRTALALNQSRRRAARAVAPLRLSKLLEALYVDDDDIKYLGVAGSMLGVLASWVLVYVAPSLL